jgi:guanyl-specific ribonuclease Sa
MAFETGTNSWNGTRVRKGDREGIVVSDYNHYHRMLTVQMDDGSVQTITMNNVREDPKEVHEWEYYNDKYPQFESIYKKWVRF